jgi:AcrR family transcriptional regulator
MSRSSLYNYVTSKEELLRRLTAQFLGAETHEIQDTLGRTDLSAVEKLERMMKQIILNLSERPALATLFEYHRDTLPDEFRLPVSERRRTINAQLIAVIRDGIDDGSFYVEDEEIASFVIGNIAVGSSRWLRPGAHVESVATTVARMAVRSLQKPKAVSRASRDPDAVLARLREDVDVLGRMIVNKRQHS